MQSFLIKHFLKKTSNNQNSILVQDRRYIFLKSEPLKLWRGSMFLFFEGFQPHVVVSISYKTFTSERSKLLLIKLIILFN